MTYTFKLSRRLAVLRSIAVLSLLALFAACAVTDATAPSPPTAPPPPGPPSFAGVPYGPFNLFKSWLVLNPVGSFNVAVGSNGPTAIVAQIDTARKYKVKLILQMTGGSHSNYLTSGKFDYVKWKAKQDQFNTAAIKEAVARGVADGTILLAELQDEPEHSTWGGVMTAALLDSMSRHTKSIFPTLKTSVLTQWTWIKGKGTFQSLDVAGTQYDHRRGTITAYRDSGVAVMARANLGVLFSMNILNGGEQLGPECPLDRTGGPGTWATGTGDPYQGNCAMMASQVEAWGKILGLTPEACALIMWRHDSTFMAKPANQAAFANVAAALAARAPRPCGR